MAQQFFLGLIIFLQTIALVMIWLKLNSLSNQSNDQALSKLIQLQENSLKSIKDEFQRSRQDNLEIAKTHRQENQKSFSDFTESLLKRMMEIATLQKQHQDSFGKQLAQLTQRNDQRHDQLKETVEKRLTVLQQDNNKKLEQMRETVDEKLHKTLEKRLGDSFKVVSDRLEQVHKGLGEMQNLAVGVGDLKKVLTNVKTRGTWGEVQCGNLLEQILQLNR